MSFMEQSTLNLIQKRTKIYDTKIYKSKAIEVKDYKDLGTWEELGNLLSKTLVSDYRKINIVIYRAKK